MTIPTREPPPHLPQPDGAGRGRGRAGGRGGEEPGGLAPPSAPSMTFQPPAPRSPAAHAPQAGRGRLARLPPVRGSGEARPAHLSTRRPRPTPGAARLPARGSAVPVPRSRTELPRSPSHRLLESESRGCVGPGVAAEGPTRLRGLRSSPFAPQRVVAATRAPRLFYRRPRAFRRRAGASAGRAPRRGARGGGERRRSTGGGAPAGSPPDRPAERAERCRKEPKRRCGGRAEPRECRGRMGKEGARQGWGLMVQRSRRLRPGGPRCSSRPALPAAWILQSCPSPPCRDSSAPRPSVPGSLSRTAAKGGAGRGGGHRCSLPWDAAHPGRKNAQSQRVRSPVCFSGAPFPQEKAEAADPNPGQG